MKISITDKGSGIVREFAKVTGARMEDRYIYIPESRGSSYITGFSWGNELRMMIGYYHFKEDVFDRTNELAEGQEDVFFPVKRNFSPTCRAAKANIGRAGQCIDLYVCCFFDYGHAIHEVLLPLAKLNNYISLNEY